METKSAAECVDGVAYGECFWTNEKECGILSHLSLFIRECTDICVLYLSHTDMFMYAKLKVKVNHEYIILISGIVFNCMVPMFTGWFVCASVFIYIHCNLMAIT